MCIEMYAYIYIYNMCVCVCVCVCVMDHKTSHKGLVFFFIEIYTSSETSINKLSIDGLLG